MSKIVIINGQGGVGKDTFINMCQKHYDGTVINISSIAPIKQIAKMIKWDGEKDKKGRKLLSDLKRVSKEYNNFPLKYVLYSIENSLQDYENPLIFVHIREVNEIEEMKNALDEVITLFIVRDNDTEYGNTSDDDVYNYDYDYVIVNEGDIDNLSLMAEKFLKSIGA